MADIRITITGLPSDGGSPITKIQCQVDGGIWRDLSGITVGSYDVTALPVGPLSTRLRAVNAIGPGVESDPKAPIVTTAPGQFTDAMWSVINITTSAQPITPFDMFPTQIRWALYQEDIVAPGPVPSWLSRGRKPFTAAQAAPANQPEKLAGNGGVLFGATLIKNLSIPNDQLAYLGNRWWLTIAKASATSATAAPIFNVNSTGQGNSFRQPYVFFQSGKLISSTHNGVGFVVGAEGVVPAASWSVQLTHRRAGKIQADTNGVKSALLDCEAWRSNSAGSVGMIGHTAAMPHDVAIDLIMMGDGELTDKQVDILVGWAHWRVGSQANLPANHPFKAAAPSSNDFVATADNHKLMAFNGPEWDAFKAASLATEFSNRGQQTYSQTGYSTVFRTDFDRVDQTPQPGSSSVGTNHPWYKPTFLTSLGEFVGPGVIQTAKTQSATGSPYDDAYAMDLSATAGGAGRPGVLTIKILKVGTIWHTGAVDTMNNSGGGRTFREGIYKTRVRYHNGSGVGWAGTNAPGLFPGPIWAYDESQMTNLHRNRIEIDYFELTGASPGNWVEGNIHFHGPYEPFPGGEVGVQQTAYGPSTSLGAHFETFGYLVNPANQHPVTLNPWDGLWHDYVAKVAADGSVIQWIDGFELMRGGPAKHQIGKRHFIINSALDHPAHGPLLLADTDQVWMDIDDFEVLYSDVLLATVPAGFSGLPTLAYAGGTYTCTPNTVGSHLVYRWYQNGVPLPTVTTPTFVTAALVGLRCQVINYGLVNHPEAWTAATT